MPAETPPGGSAARLRGLDALRGIAALSVVFYHYTSGYLTFLPPGQQAAVILPFRFELGAMGVELFFIISGFVIFMTIERTATLGGFVVSRVARLYPAFLACLGVTLVVAIIGNASGQLPWRILAYPSAILANLTMAPRLLHRPEIDPSYWSLLYELVFYTLAATAAYLLRWRSAEWLGVGWLAITLGLRLTGLASRVPLLEMLTATSFAYLFVIGMMLYRHFTGTAGYATYCVLGLAVAMAALGSFRMPEGSPPGSYLILIVSFTTLVWLATCQSVPGLRSGLLPALGDISYPLYLVHQIVGVSALWLLLNTGMPASLAIALTVCGAIALAWCISVAIERPGRRIVRAWGMSMLQSIPAPQPRGGP